jgi:hypothetical protein
MTKLVILIFLAAVAAPSVKARDTKDAQQDFFDVCNQFVINDPVQLPYFGFSTNCILYDLDAQATEWRMQ